MKECYLGMSGNRWSTLEARVRRMKCRPEDLKWWVKAYCNLDHDYHTLVTVVL